MRSLRRDPKATNRKAGPSFKSGGDVAEDAASLKLSQMGKLAGNEAMADQLNGAGSKRDELLEFIVKRLEVMHKVQLVERGRMNDERDWFRAVARGYEENFLPDPSRWHEAARLYLKSADAMCAGNLGRGVDLLDKAVEAERAAFESVPQQVEEEMESKDLRTEQQPATVTTVGGDATCPVISRPAGLNVAEKILSILDAGWSTPPLNRKKRRKGWWEEHEEEEEDEEDGG